MTRRRSRLTGRRAFTLLELLIATAVGAVVLLVINATFFSALRLHTATHDRIDQDLELQRALAIIRRDLTGIMLPANPNSTTTSLRGQLSTESFSSSTGELVDGERISPDITTSSGRIDGWNAFADVQLVAYYLQPDATGRNTKTLVRAVTRNLLPVQDYEATAEKLLPGVLTASMSFYDGYDWIETWDSATTSTLPSAIKLTLVIAPKSTSGLNTFNPAPVELIVPVLVMTSQSAQDAAAAAAAAP